jgi:hypothetical protein
VPPVVTTQSKAVGKLSAARSTDEVRIHVPGECVLLIGASSRQQRLFGIPNAANDQEG